MFRLKASDLKKLQCPLKTFLTFSFSHGCACVLAGDSISLPAAGTIRVDIPLSPAAP